MLQIIHGLEYIPASLANTAVAVGVFDGVHRGHQEILRQTAQIARAKGLTPIALTFDIHPSELFAPQGAPAYIATLEQRAHWMETLGGGIDAMIVARFDAAFASLTPEAFVTEVLLQRLHARHVLVGTDFCYGKGRAGTVASLQAAGLNGEFGVSVVPPLLLDGTRVSSTQVRLLVTGGDIPAAAALLGHPFTITGKVVRGKGLGRVLGYPTANVRPAQPGQLLPANAVYAAVAHLADGRAVHSAVSVGVNPSTDSDNARKIEAYLMDGFQEDLYGQALGIEFHAKVRNEERFDTLPALVAQIARDVEQVRGLLRTMAG